MVVVHSICAALSDEKWIVTSRISRSPWLNGVYTDGSMLILVPTTMFRMHVGDEGNNIKYRT